MATQPRSPELLRETYDAWIAHGKNAGAAARSLKRAESTFKAALDECKERGMHLSEGARSAVTSANLSGTEARAGWIVQVDPETGSRKSTYWRAPELPVDDLLDKIRTAFEGIIPAKPAVAPKAVMDDLMTVYPLFDVHLGMLAWGAETGSQDYDTKIAADDMRYAFAKIHALTPQSRSAIVLLGGDFFHADNDDAVTKKSKHHLDVDGRQFKVLETGIQLIAETVEVLLNKHDDITIRVLRGNHDEDSHKVMTFALFERYRDEPRVVVEKDPRDLFMKQWGRCLISAHHGDKAKPQQLTLYLSDVCPYWSDTRHRFMFTGHVHHEQSKDVGPLRWESLRAFCPPDSYASGMSYATRRALQSITFHKTDGLVLRAADPIERPL
jgi:hypothetical protein